MALKPKLTKWLRVSFDLNHWNFSKIILLNFLIWNILIRFLQLKENKGLVSMLMNIGTSLKIPKKFEVQSYRHTILIAEPRRWPNHTQYCQGKIHCNRLKVKILVGLLIPLYLNYIIMYLYPNFRYIYFNNIDKLKSYIAL